MRTTVTNFGRCAALLLGIALVAAAQGQAPEKAPPPKERPTRPAPPDKVPAGAHRLEIYEGPNRTVYYFGGGTPAERRNLMALELAENDLTYAQNLHALKRQYVNSERILEPQRRYVQEQLYGVQISYGTYNSLAGYGFGYGGYAYPYAYPYNWGGYGMTAANGYLGGGYTSFVRSLQFGMGDEGVLKSAFAPVIARDAASPDYMAQALTNYSAALARVGPLPQDGRSGDWGPVTLTLNDGKKVEGTAMHEKGDWYVVDIDGGGKTYVRKTEVKRIDQSKS
jgi:hypothetical protein